MRTITLAITTYQRFDLLLKSFMYVLHDERISEIVIVDDASDKEVFDQIENYCKQYPKIKLYQNLYNQDCYRNKQIAVSHSSNEWCILFDSDNEIDRFYIDAIFSFDTWDKDTVYQPVFASPNFDFRAFSNLIIRKDNVSWYMNQPMFSTALNAMNYFVNKKEYLDVWDENINPHTADSIYQNYRWLDRGKKILFVKGLEYFHRIHDGSHYKNNNHKTGNVYEIIENRLKQMK
jgi:Glycosyl transferase family 2